MTFKTTGGAQRLDQQLSLYFDSEAEIGGGHLHIEPLSRELVYEIVARHHNASLEGGSDVLDKCI